MTAKEKLLLWSQRMVEGYQGLRCDNFTSSWRDGRLFNAIIHRHKYVAWAPPLGDCEQVGARAVAGGARAATGARRPGRRVPCQPPPWKGAGRPSPTRGLPSSAGAFLKLRWLP